MAREYAVHTKTKSVPGLSDGVLPLRVPPARGRGPGAAGAAVRRVRADDNADRTAEEGRIGRAPPARGVWRQALARVASRFFDSKARLRSRTAFECGRSNQGDPAHAKPTGKGAAQACGTANSVLIAHTIVIRPAALASDVGRAANAGRGQRVHALLQPESVVAHLFYQALDSLSLLRLSCVGQYAVPRFWLYRSQKRRVPGAVTAARWESRAPRASQ